MRVEQSISWPAPGDPALIWLGQAGFWIETGEHRVLIDPYLSDSLAKKYAGTKHPHKRMMQAPCVPQALPRPDLVLITHAHTDHMDPETLAPLQATYPDLPFVVPKSKLKEAEHRIGTRAELLPVDADDRFSPMPGLDIAVFPAAHETLEKNIDGHHMFLGFGITSAGLKIFHSGDTIPFDGLADRITAFAPDIALLPVNGRDSQRLADGIPGNMTFDEALSLATNVSVLIPHHWGMFDFNSADPVELLERAARISMPQIHIPVCGARVQIKP